MKHDFDQQPSAWGCHIFVESIGAQTGAVALYQNSIFALLVTPCVKDIDGPALDKQHGDNLRHNSRDTPFIYRQKCKANA